MGGGGWAFSWKHGDSTQWERRLVSVIYSMGRIESMPLSLPPWSCRDKSPRILLWRGREERALECGDTSYSATLARSPQAFKAPRAVQQASYTLSRKGPKTGNRDYVASRLPASESSAWSGWPPLYSKERSQLGPRLCSPRITVPSLPKAECAL